MQPVIKWTGSKRHIASEICIHFSDRIRTYYEPFIGGGSVLVALINSAPKVERYVASDICLPLIQIWQIVKDDPTRLLSGYASHHDSLSKFGRDYYFDVRKRFNTEFDPIDFFFLLRTARNGLVRFNSKGEFNSCFHDTRNGIEPEKLERIVMDWSHLLKWKKVEFVHKEYQKISPLEGDFVYCDPPYRTSDSFYESKFDFDQFFGWLKELKCNYAVSFSGDIPVELYAKKILMPPSPSAFKKLDSARNGKTEIKKVDDWLFVR